MYNRIFEQLVIILRRRVTRVTRERKRRVGEKFSQPKGWGGWGAIDERKDSIGKKNHNTERKRKSARQRERERGRERVVTSCSRDSTTHVAAKSYKTGISRVPLQAGRITRLVSSRLSAIVDALQLAATRLVDHSNLNDLSRGWIRPRRISRDLNINFGAGLWPRGDN